MSSTQDDDQENPLANPLYQLGLQHGQQSVSLQRSQSTQGQSNQPTSTDPYGNADNPTDNADYNPLLAGSVYERYAPNTQQAPAAQPLPALPGADGYQAGNTYIAGSPNAANNNSLQTQQAQDWTAQKAAQGNSAVTYTNEGGTVVAHYASDGPSPGQKAGQQWAAMSPAQQQASSAATAAQVDMQDANAVLASLAAGKSPTSDPSLNQSSVEMMAMAAAQHGQSLQDYANSLVAKDKNTIQQWTDMQANDQFQQGLQAAGGSTAAQAAAQTANNATANNAYAASAAAGGAMGGHAAAFNAAATTGVQNGATALAQATDKVNNLSNQLTYTTNAINNEIQQHTVSAGVAINQMNDTLSSLSQQLGQNQSQDALNLKTQADSLQNQLQTLQLQYQQRSIDESQFWSTFKVITGALATVAGAVTANPALIAGGVALAGA